MKKCILGVILATALAGCGSDSVVEAPVVEAPVVEAPVVEEPVVDLSGWTDIGDGREVKNDADGNMLSYDYINGDYTVPMNPDLYNARKFNDDGVLTSRTISADSSYKYKREIVNLETITSDLSDLDLFSSYSDNRELNVENRSSWTLTVRYHSNVLKVIQNDRRAYGSPIVDCKYYPTEKSAYCYYYGSGYSLDSDFGEGLEKVLSDMRIDTVGEDWPMLIKNEFLKYMGVL